MAWKFESGIPIASQIVEKLRSDILSGGYTEGGAFPTVRQLAFEASVNPNTVQKALYLLESEGLLITHGTAGRFVTDNKEILEASRQKLTLDGVKQIIDEAKKLGITKNELIELIRKEWNEND